MTAKPTLVQTFERDDHSLYGLWRLEINGETRDVGCVIGVPASERNSAANARTTRGYINAWYADSSDWSDEAERDAALAIMQDAAVALCAEHEVA